MTNKDRKHSILAAALELAADHGFEKITRDQIAARAECATGLVSLYLGTMVQLRRAVMSEAIRTRNLNVLAQGLVAKHPKAEAAPDDLKREAVASILGV